MNATSPALCLQDLLLSKARSRSGLSSKLSVGITLASICMFAVCLWSTISLDQVRTSSLYGVLAVFAAIMIGVIVYSSLTWSNNYKIKTDPSGVRSWQKKAYKLLSGLTIVEHCVFFTSVPIMLYHALGLSMSECLSSKTCFGSEYSSWVTVSVKDFKVRVQELKSEPVQALLGTSNLAIFSGLLASLVLGVLAVVLYLYGEASRRCAQRSGKVHSRIGVIRRRKLFVRIMGLASFCQLIFSILGVALVRNNWFAACIVLAVLSAYPIYKLFNGLTKDPTITRFQLRKISQRSISLVFIWLYCSGLGISAACISAIDLPSEEIVSLIGKSALAQLILILVFHLVFSILSGAAIYTHLSVTDVIESLAKTKATASLDNDHALDQRKQQTETSTEVHTPDHGGQVLPWETTQCASCSINQSNCVLVPCGHSVICSECSRGLMTIPGFRCPVCCTEVIDSQVIPSNH
jgi:hypothetical protein